MCVCVCVYICIYIYMSVYIIEMLCVCVVSVFENGEEILFTKKQKCFAYARRIVEYGLCVLAASCMVWSGGLLGQYVLCRRRLVVTTDLNN